MMEAHKPPEEKLVREGILNKMVYLTALGALIYVYQLIYRDFHILSKKARRREVRKIMRFAFK